MKLKFCMKSFNQYQRKKLEYQLCFLNFHEKLSDEHLHEDYPEEVQHKEMCYFVYCPRRHVLREQVKKHNILDMRKKYYNSTVKKKRLDISQQTKSTLYRSHVGAGPPPCL